MKLYLLSRLSGDRSGKLGQGKRQSWSTLQGLRVGTSFVKFWQLQEVGVFSYLYYSLAKGHFNGWGFVKVWKTVFSTPKDLDRVKKSLEWCWTVQRLFVWLV